MPNFYNLLKPFKIIKDSFINPNFNADLYIHSLVLFTFLTVLFIAYLMKVSTDSFKLNIGTLLENSIKPYIDTIKENPLIKNNIINLKGLINNINTPDKYTENNTYNIKKILLLINILLWVFIIGFIIIFNKTSCNSNINWVEIAITTSITFICIGFIEFIFLKFIIMKIQPIEPSFLVKELLEKTKHKFN
jgi:hypothetical protein